MQGEGTLEPEQIAHLSTLGIQVIAEPVTQIEALPGPTVKLTTNAGSTHAFDTLYPMIGCEPRIELLNGLNARGDSFNQLWVDERQQTSIPGIYAAGDVVHSLNQMAVGAAHAAIAATAIHNTLPKNYWDEPSEKLMRW